ncbi:MAG: YCF48-related protein [Candidatus Dormiibacterota bacterium]
MSARALGRRFRRWQVMAVCLAISVAALGLIGWGALGAWQGLTDNPDSVSAASASSVPLTSRHCSGSSPAYSSCGDTSGRMQLSWSAVTGSPGITVQRATSPSGPYSTIATLAGTATGYTDTTAADNAQYYYEVFSGAPGWASAADVDMALSLPPTGGTDNTAGTGGSAFTAANLTAMSAAGSGGYTTTTPWGGANANPLGNNQANAVTCVSANQCWAVTQQGTIWATSDGGDTWTEQSAPGQQLFAVDFINASDGWAVGGNKENIYGTVNGGTTWTSLHSHPGATFYGVEFANANDGWVVGSGGTIWASTDGGATWTAQTSGTNQQLNAISCASASQCWAVGNQGVILSTSDGGAVWSAQASGVTGPGPGAANLTAIFCVSATQCWAVGDATGGPGGSGTILATTDGGTTWTKQSSGTTQNLNGVSCVSATQCVVVGDNGALLSTSNGGATWAVETSGTNQTLYGVSCASATQCVVAGNGVVLLGSGGSWYAPSAQFVQWTFSPTVAGGAPVTSAILTLLDSASATPNAATETLLLVSANSGSSWTQIQIANPTNASTVQTVNLGSVISSGTAVSGLELRYEIIGSNAFKSTFDLVHVDIN